MIGVEEYGYWQLYLFYASYVGFLHFGWNDGIYLRFGGNNYDSLNKKLFFSQFYTLLFSQLVFAIVIIALTTLLTSNNERNFIYLMVAICLVVTNSRWMLIYTLQATNRIKEYAKITVTGRVIYILIISISLITGFREYRLMILADIIGKSISLIYAALICKDIIFRNIGDFYISLKEIIANISVGSKLMFATIASMLIIGIVRFGIERAWDVSTFGKISLTLSASNMIMLFINAVGIVVFPILKRTDIRSLPQIYSLLRDALMLLILGILLLYYPLKEALTIWLPKYEDSLKYMALLFPIVIFEGKMALLINTYMKALRKESQLLKINIISLSLSLFTTITFTYIYKNLNLLVVSIVFLLAVRCILGEIVLRRTLKIRLFKDIVLEILIAGLFIYSGWCIDSWYTVLIYFTGYLTYIIIKRKDLISSIDKLKKISLSQ